MNQTQAIEIINGVGRFIRKQIISNSYETMGIVSKEIEVKYLFEQYRGTDELGADVYKGIVFFATIINGEIIIDRMGELLFNSEPINQLLISLIKDKIAMMEAKINYEQEGK